MRNRKITSERVVLTSFIVDVSDIALNTIVTLLTGSVVVLSQALKGAADLLATGFLLLGTFKANKPGDRKHPFGHGRELYFWTFLSALATFTITAGFSFYFGFNRFLNPQAIENLPLTYLALTVAALANGYSFHLGLKRLLGRKPIEEVIHTFKFSALIETKTTLVLDLMGTTASVFGLFALILYELTGNLKFDGIGAMTIAITLAILALFIIKAAKDLLVGQSAPPEVEDEIIKHFASFPVSFRPETPKLSAEF